jgi:hypothetical protein
MNGKTRHHTGTRRRSREKAPASGPRHAESNSELQPLAAILLFGPRNAVEQRRLEHFTRNQDAFVRSFSGLNLDEPTIRSFVYQSLRRLRITESKYRYAVTRMQWCRVASDLLRRVSADVLERSIDPNAMRPQRKEAPKGFLSAGIDPRGISLRADGVPLGKGFVYSGQGQTRKAGSHRSQS